ncbi:MAG TPA: carbonic anhydrase [Micromonosporaceae bacterium]|jgi:carbonic anhydrase
MTDSVPTDPDQALRLLLAGNRRFVLGRREHPNQDADRRTAVAPGQRPFAVLFGCSDSRLAAEIIFDRGLGDLFVVRTAGHVVGPEVLGSIEYGIAILDVPLVAVLGHDSCGGVAAALQVARDGEMPPGAIGSVVERVLPSVLAAGGGETDPDVAGEEHVRHTVELLANESATIARRVAAGRCAVVGLSYQLADGSVRMIAQRGLPQAVGQP